MLGADGLLYQTHADLIAVGHDLNPAITQFEDSCFTGARCLAVLHFLLGFASVTIRVLLLPRLRVGSALSHNSTDGAGGTWRCSCCSCAAARASWTAASADTCVHVNDDPDLVAQGQTSSRRQRTFILEGFLQAST